MGIKMAQISMQHWMQNEVQQMIQNLVQKQMQTQTKKWLKIERNIRQKMGFKGESNT